MGPSAANLRDPYYLAKLSWYCCYENIGQTGHNFYHKTIIDISFDYQLSDRYLLIINYYQTGIIWLLWIIKYVSYVKGRSQVVIQSWTTKPFWSCMPEPFLSVRRVANKGSIQLSIIKYVLNYELPNMYHMTINYVVTT